MSIIQPVTSPTVEQRQARAVARINASINGLYRQMLTVYNANMEIVWSNSDGLTPQQVLDGFTTEGGELLRLTAALTTAVNTATPDVIPPPSVVLNVAEDGTVTIG